MSKPYFNDSQFMAIADACDHAIKAAEKSLARLDQIPPEWNTAGWERNRQYWRNVKSAAKWIKAISKQRKKDSTSNGPVRSKRNSVSTTSRSRKIAGE